MIRKFLMVAVVVAIGCVVAAPAQAGGTGTKKVATIRVKNGTLTPGQNIAVLPQVPTANIPSQSAFQSAGGQVIAPNAVGSFKVPAGNGTFAAAYVPTPVVFPINPAVFIPGVDYATCLVIGTAGKTGYVLATGNSGAPTLFLGGAPAGVNF